MTPCPQLQKHARGDDALSSAMPASPRDLFFQGFSRCIMPAQILSRAYYQIDALYVGQLSHDQPGTNA